MQLRARFSISIMKIVDDRTGAFHLLLITDTKHVCIQLPPFICAILPSNCLHVVAGWLRIYVGVIGKVHSRESRTFGDLFSFKDEKIRTVRPDIKLNAVCRSNEYGDSAFDIAGSLHYINGIIYFSIFYIIKIRKNHLLIDFLFVNIIIITPLVLFIWNCDKLSHDFIVINAV